MDGKFLLLILCLGSTTFAATWLVMTPAKPLRGEVPAFDKRGKVVHFNNCEEVRAAGLAPLWSGKPGYTQALDPQGLGFACPPA